MSLAPGSDNGHTNGNEKQHTGRRWHALNRAPLRPAASVLELRRRKTEVIQYANRVCLSQNVYVAGISVQPS